MSCERCGMSCQGAMCRDCERMDHQEEYYGTPADVRERQEEADDE